MDETLPLRPSRANKLFDPTRLEEQTRALFKSSTHSLSASVVGERTLWAKLWIYLRRASKREPGTIAQYAGRIAEEKLLKMPIRAL